MRPQETQATAWLDRAEALPGWAYSHLSISDAVRTVWHDWDLVAEAAEVASRGFLLRQVDWWQIVDVPDWADAPEQYDPEDSVPFKDSEYEEWAEMDGDERRDKLIRAARRALTAPSLTALPEAVHDAHIEHVMRVHGGRGYNVNSMTCTLLTAAARMDVPGSDTLLDACDDAARHPWLALGMKELRETTEDQACLPVYPWSDHPDPSERTEWFEFIQREWAPSRNTYRPWSDPFPVGVSDFAAAWAALQAADAAESTSHGLQPIERRLVRVVRQEL